jgi:uronate dehydrogenase
MDVPKRVLVTGAAGTIGRAVCRALQEAGHFVRGLDLAASALANETLAGNIADFEVVMRAAAGMTTVIHLAATTDDADFMKELLTNNVVGVVNILEASRLAGVKRVALASSMQVADGFRAWDKRVVRVEDGTSPRNGYAATKVFAEAMGHVYFVKHKMEVICPRIGWSPRHEKAARQIGERGGDRVYLSHDDAGRFFLRCVEARKILGKEEGYAVVYCVSRRLKNEGPDMEAAREAIGYEAVDYYPQGLPAEWSVDSGQKA